MNLHAVANGAIRAVNPQTSGTIQASTGYTTAADGRRVPTYAAPVPISIQEQDLSTKDLQMIDGLNLQSETKALYLYGDWNGVSRADQQGGDLVTMTGGVWLIVQVAEAYPGWCKVIVCRQVP